MDYIADLWRNSKKTAEEKRIIHRFLLIDNTYSSCDDPTLEELDDGSKARCTEITLCVNDGDNNWQKLVDKLKFAMMLEFREAPYWTSWVARGDPNHWGESEDRAKVYLNLINLNTDDKVLAKYITDPAWEFYFKAESKPSKFVLMNHQPSQKTSNPEDFFNKGI